MKNLVKDLLWVFVILVVFPVSSAAEEKSQYAMIRHELSVKVFPAERRFTAVDTITLPADFSGEQRFLLHKGLKPVSLTSGVEIVSEKTVSGVIPLESFKVKLPPGMEAFVIKYGGTVHHPLEAVVKEQARGFDQTPGLISEEGVYLSGGSHWYPAFDDSLMTFTLRVELPAGWDAVSQGERTSHDKEREKTLVDWESPEPQDEIFLIAARFTEYVRQAGKISAMVFLRSPDKGLADKYLDATVRYVAMYEKLLGPYPYKKFALVENFWETGFGMPSFTLLGPKVIRFPFIINSSYPHEILHNWWGNSVFPDYGSGNWSEGLTAYLADHLIREQQGAGTEYRQTTLQKYADYVLSGRDFPLTEFRSRHSSPSEAVGYGKSLMFFHMLRRELGDKIFISGLRNFYGENKSGFASFEDLKRSFEKVSEKDLGADFDQWIRRRGAPELKVSNVHSRTEGEGFVLTALIEQVQDGDPYHLRIPVAVTMEGRGSAFQTKVAMEKRRLEFTLLLPARPLRIDIDPEFDLFRRLDRSETPPAISQALGAKKMLIILPSSAGSALLQAYRKLAKDLSNSGPDVVETRLDKEAGKIPPDHTVVILGWENRYLKDAAAALSAYDVSLHPEKVRIGKTEIPRNNHSIVLAARSPENKDMALLFIASDRADSLPGLGRKLPHYHKYSFLGFEGDEPVNIEKGRWPVIDSPMTIFLPDKDGSISKVEMGKLSPREPLATLPPAFSAEEMMQAIRFLSGDEMKGRGLGTPELDKAADYIADKFKEAGLRPAGDDGSFFQTWKESFPENRGFVMKNVIGMIPGKRPDMAGQSVVVAAHYDHLGLGWPDVREGNRGKIHPGADDNASGVAVLIELAKVLGATNPERSIIFAAFTGEEAGRRGSKYYVANRKQYPAEKVIGMVNLDTVGRLGKGKLLILGAGSAKEWVHIFRGAGFVTGVEIEMVPARLDSSDNISFEDAGIPAVQIFSGPHLDYHRPADTADKIDPEGLIKVGSVAREVIEYLAGSKATLSVTAKLSEEGGPTPGRKVSLGTIPDFSFTGKGYRISGVAPNSPAASGGLREGDIIIRINENEIQGLKDLSDVLKSLVPGAKISVTFMREGKEMTVEAEVEAR